MLVLQMMMAASAPPSSGLIRRFLQQCRAVAVEGGMLFRLEALLESLAEGGSTVDVATQQEFKSLRMATMKREQVRIRGGTAASESCLRELFCLRELPQLFCLRELFYPQRAPRAAASPRTFCCHSAKYVCLSLWCCSSGRERHALTSRAARFFELDFPRLKQCPFFSETPPLPVGGQEAFAAKMGKPPLEQQKLTYDAVPGAGAASSPAPAPDANRSGAGAKLPFALCLHCLRG